MANPCRVKVGPPRPRACPPSCMSHRARALLLTHLPTAPKTGLSGSSPLHVSRASQLRRVPLFSFLPDYPGTPPSGPPRSFLFGTCDGEAGFRGCNYRWGRGHILHLPDLHTSHVANYTVWQQLPRTRNRNATTGFSREPGPTPPPLAPRSSGHGILPMLLAGLMTPCSILLAWTDGPRKTLSCLPDGGHVLVFRRLSEIHPSFRTAEAVPRKGARSRCFAMFPLLKGAVSSTSGARSLPTSSGIRHTLLSEW